MAPSFKNYITRENGSELLSERSRFLFSVFRRGTAIIRRKCTVEAGQGGISGSLSRHINFCPCLKEFSRMPHAEPEYKMSVSFSSTAFHDSVYLTVAVMKVSSYFGERHISIMGLDETENR